MAQLQGRVLAIRPLPHRGLGLIMGLVHAKGRLISAEEVGKHNSLTGWDPKSRQRIWRLKAPGPMVDLQRSANGKSVLVTTDRGTNLVYRVDSSPPKLYRKWKRKRGRNKGRTQGLTADGKMLVRGDVRGQVRGYALEKYKMKWLVKADRVVLGRDGKVAACVKGQQVQLRDATTGRVLGKPWKPGGVLRALAGHTRSVWAWFSGCGAGCGARPRPRLRNDQKPCELRVTGRGAMALVCLDRAGLAWSPDGKRLALFGRGRARIYQVDPKRLRLLHIHRARAKHQRVMVAFVGNDRYVVANLRRAELAFYRLVKR